MYAMSTTSGSSTITRSNSCEALLSKLLLKSKDILALDTLVFHFVHNLTDQEYAKSSDLTVLRRQAYVGIRDHCRIKLLTGIRQNEYDGTFMQTC